ncbi:methyl-accepting chemotaxis protein [Thiohalobacter sp. IOR34]|uniref:methyl-accepting chemotaxis protein n=1 Tax=Thiohalobacter sp. IOR34 TaxID=3057176 RepID=UPI0025AF340E|nr:methyl-accepting chemotaxis protein [Thiohalobacter sp. IOR34]WJW76195.1 methyl-accepting chemotaxis protein [Thiohalobacter sp. IOR34]
MKKSILRRLLLASLLFGLFIGALFPLFAQLFVDWKDGMFGWFVLSCLLGGGLVGLSNYWLVQAILLRKLRRISEVANAISQNDVSQHCEIESHDLIGEIVDSFNRMAANLREVIGEISGVTAQLASAAEEMSAITDEASRGVQRQHQEIERVATAMGEMNHTVQDMAEQAGQAAESACRADSEARSGAELSTEARAGIGKLVSEVEKASGVIGRLEQESDNIGMVLDVIRGIAEQTNLLALNAAIEAARAGEQGRGFAVVADEVRTLASRTQQSTEEIQGMIEQLQTGSRDAVQVMRAAQEMAHGSASQVEEAAGSLCEIAEAVAFVSGQTSRIAEAARSQSQVASEINGNVEAIQVAADQTAAGAQQTASASDELARLSSQLQTLMARFRT